MPTKRKPWIPLLVFIGGIILIPNWWRIELSLNPVHASGQEVKMYSTSWCPYCAKAREYFETANIAYSEFDIERSTVANQEYLRLNGRGVPLIVIGQQAIQGFDRHAIRKALEKTQPAPREGTQL